MIVMKIQIHKANEELYTAVDLMTYNSPMGVGKDVMKAIEDLLNKMVEK